MKFYQLSVCLSLVLPAAFALAVKPSVLGPDDGVICSPIHQYKGRAHIRIHGDRLPQDTKIPALIFHYTDLLNFTNIPSVESYYKAYPNNLPEGLFSADNDKFNLQPADGSDIDAVKIYNGYIDKNRDIEYIIQQSGIFCVYLGKTDVTVPVVFKNSYGNLPYPMYVVYSQLKWVLLLAIALFAYLLNYILKFKVGDDFKNLDSVSVISKGVIFLVLIPFILLHIYQWIPLFLQNNFINSSQDNVLVGLASFIAEFFSAAFNVYISCLLLLFTMGYGVIYYHNGTSRHYRMFPKGTFAKISGFFVANLVVLYIYMLLMNRPSTQYPFLSGFGNLAQFDSDSGSFSSIFTVLVGLFSITWSILTIYNYFQTKKAIAKFPPSSTDADSTEKVVSAFRKSIYVILVLPIVVMFIGGFIGAYKFSQKITEGSLPKEPIGRPQDYESVLTFFSMENSLEDFLSPVLISNWVYFFATVVFLFFIWIKDNNGLIIDRNVNDPIENADVSQFDVSSDNE